MTGRVQFGEALDLRDRVGRGAGAGGATRRVAPNSSCMCTRYADWLPMRFTGTANGMYVWRGR